MNKQHIVEVLAGHYHRRFGFEDMQDAMRFANTLKAEGECIDLAHKDGETRYYSQTPLKISLLLDETVFESEEAAEKDIDRQLRSEMEEDLREMDGELIKQTA